MKDPASITRPTDMVWLGLFFGVASGVTEVLFRLLAYSLLNRPFYEEGWNLVWAVPMSHLLLFGLLGLLLALVFMFRRGDALFRAAMAGLVAVGVFATLLNYHSLHVAARILLSLGIGIQVGGLLARRAFSFRKLVRAVTVPAIGLVVLTAGGYRLADTLSERSAMSALPNARPDSPNVLLVVLDVVRAADMSLYGYPRRTTPNLDRFARKSVVFENAYSTSPWTLPSHAGMFTGRYAHALSADWQNPLDNEYPTLAERLQQHGYATAGFVANFFYGVPEFGLSRGFIHYESRRMNLGSVLNVSAFGSILIGRFNQRTGSYYRPERRHASEFNERLLEWLPRRRGHPFFVFVNYIDAHLPYVPPAPYDLMFAGKEPPTRRNRIGEKKTPEELQGLRDVYDGAIAYEDAQLGALLTALQRRGELSNTIVIITSDHGEEFAEHGWVAHGNGLNLPALHVPLIVAFPGRIPPGIRVPDGITLRDLPSTVAELTGLQKEIQFPGRSLSSHWDSTRVATNEFPSPLLATLRPRKGEPAWYAGAQGNMYSIIDGRYQFIVNGDKSEALYDIASDPWEQADLARLPASAQVLIKVRAALRAGLRAR